MWFEDTETPPRWNEAVQHLINVDPLLKDVIRRVGPCTMTPRRDYFVALCKAIFSQQLSTVVAAALFSRFRNVFPNRRPTPELFLSLTGQNPDALRGCGLSRQKAVYLKDLAEHFATNRIPTRKLSAMSDEEVVQTLIAVKGVGRWTAEMFLMFVLNRADVLPVDDLGLREGIREIYGLAERPTAKEVTDLCEKWRPFRSIGTWYTWRRKETGGIAQIPPEEAALETKVPAPREIAPSVRKRKVAAISKKPRQTGKAISRSKRAGANKPDKFCRN